MRIKGSVWLVATLSILFSTLAASGQVTAAAPYSFTVFASSVTGQYTKPDSIAVVDGHVFIGYGNNVAVDGTDGKSSTIVEYTMKGDVVKTYSVPGHNDGLRVNPRTKHLWSLQNEDHNPALVIIDPEEGTQRSFTFGPAPHGGGYDDMAFQGDDVFISASNPANDPNTAPAIVRAHLDDGVVNVTSVLAGNSSATDVATGGAIAALNLQDPDSMIFDPFGDIVMTSQSDAELIIVHHPGRHDQSVFHLGLTLAGVAAQVDDTVFATSSHGVLLVSDRDGEKVYAVTKPIFSPYEAFTAESKSVGTLNLDTGVITPILTGTVSPHGMAFIGAGRDDDRERN
jgi:hypothetical protein